MKDNVVIVNCSRGALVDTDAVIEKDLIVERSLALSWTLTKMKLESLNLEFGVASEFPDKRSKTYRSFKRPC